MRRVVLLIPALLLLAACNSDMDPLAKDFMAYDACTDAAAQQLKAPGSADFQGKTSVDYTTSGDTITVSGWVDAANSYGAKLRTTWTCSTDVASDGATSNTVATVDGG